MQCDRCARRASPHDLEGDVDDLPRCPPDTVAASRIRGTSTESPGAYYAPLDAGGFTGGQFDAFDPSASRAASANVFTADDVVSVSLLSVDVPGRATLELLDRQRARFSALLAAAGPDMDLVDVESTDPQRFPIRALNDALRELPNVGPTTASKLLARKRPRLIPIFDSVINEHLLKGTGRLWEPLRLAPARRRSATASATA